MTQRAVAAIVTGFAIALLVAVLYFDPTGSTNLAELPGPTSSPVATESVANATETPAFVEPARTTALEATAEPLDEVVVKPTPTSKILATPEPSPPSEDAVIVEVTTTAASFDDAMQNAQLLNTQIVVPSDCGLPLAEHGSLPNSSRGYRNGVHQGVDFICLERGRTAVAAMPGRVVIASGSFEDPSPEDRDAVLQIAAQVGNTPQYVLDMLYGRFVVIDHGPVAGVGHAFSIYAHFEELDPNLRIGGYIKAGTPLGEIGNRGTESGATGILDPRSLHLHWELHVDGQYFGIGLSGAETATLYGALFDGK